MDESNDLLLSIQLKCLEVIGFRRYPPWKYSTLINAYYSFNIIVVALCMCSELNFVLQGYHDILGSAEAFGPFSTEVISIAKFLTIYYRKDELFSLIDQVEELSAKGVFNEIFENVLWNHF